MQNDLLLEIGTEELPARFIPAAITGIKDAAERLLKDNRIQYREISVYGTPRRLALIVREAEEIHEDIVIEVSGPPKSAAYGADGTPTKAAVGFAKSQVIELNFAGVSSGRISYGHHFMSPQSFVINSPDDYINSLKERLVIADQSERRKIVQEQLKAISHEKGGRVIPVEELLKEVAYLTEYPIAVCGRFDDCFLSLPKDVLATVLREHQRSFLIEKERGEGLPYFITVSNTIPKDLDVIRSGYERVVRARLSDAKFFFDADSKVRLEDRSVKLEKVVFMAKLGTMSEKVVRLMSSVSLLSELFEWSEIASI